MTRLLRNCTIVVMAIALAATVACSDAQPPETEPDWQPSPTPVTITPEPDPSPTPDTPIEEVLLLEYDKYYFMYGDPDSFGIVFLESGVAFDTDGDEFMFEVEGSEIVVLGDGETDSRIRIIDSFTLEMLSYGIILIREGGEGFGIISSGFDAPPLFFFNEHYYLNGDDSGISLYFLDDGDVEIDGSPEFAIGRYMIDEDVVTLIVDGYVFSALRVVNCIVLEDVETLEMFTLAGALDRTLALDAFYYMEGDKNDLSLYFWDDGEVDFDIQGMEIAIGTYTLDGYVITLELDDEETELIIVNSYILESDDGFVFIRIP